MVTVSLLLALIGLAPIIWDPTVGRSVPEFFADTPPVTIAGVGVSIHRIIIFGSAILVAIGLRLFLYNTRTGIAMRAVVDDRSLAQLNGARPGLTSMASWGLGAGLAALAASNDWPVLRMSPPGNRPGNRRGADALAHLPALGRAAAERTWRRVTSRGAERR